MAKLSAQEMAAKWAQKFAASGDQYEKGINRVNVSPAGKAIAARERMVTNWTAAINSGKWERNLAAVSLGQWKAACIEKGKATFAAVARLAQDKVMRAEAKMGPLRDAIIMGLPPRGDIEANILRSSTYQRMMHQQMNDRGGGGAF